MSHCNDALPILKRERPNDIPDFQLTCQAGKAKIPATDHLFRLRSAEHAKARARLVRPVTQALSPALMHTLFVGGDGHTPKWFTVDRPSLFNRQAVTLDALYTGFAVGGLRAAHGLGGVMTGPRIHRFDAFGQRLRPAGGQAVPCPRIAWRCGR